MCILTETRISRNSNNTISMIYDEKPKLCPVCGKILHYRDKRRRIIKTSKGETFWCIVRRFKCVSCNRLHTEIPEQLTPYKHYEASAIEDVLDDITDESDPVTVDGPSEQTIKRWRWWFTSNKNRLCGYIRSSQQKILEKSLPSEYGISYLKTVRERGAGWLHHVLCFVYNLGGYLVPFYEKKVYLHRLKCTYLGSTVNSA